MYLRVLDALISQVSAKAEPAELLGQALDILLDAFHAEIGGAYVLDDERKTLRLIATRGNGVRRLSEVRTITSNSELWAPTPGARLATLGDCQDPVALRLRSLGCQTLAVVPLTEQTGCLGHLFFATNNRLDLEGEGQELLNSVGRIIGLAIANSHLYQEMQHQLRQSQALYDVSRALASTRDLESLLSLIVQSAVETIPKANNGVLHLLDEETGELHPRALSFVGGVRPDVSGRSRMRLGQGIAGYALELGEMVNVPDVSSDERFIRVGNVRSFTSMLVAPLKLGERKLGTLSIDSQQTHAFSEVEERLLMTLASQAAVAIENTRLINDLQQSLQDLKQAQEQLIQSEKLSAIGQLIAGVAHELNNPLTAIMGYSQLLQISEDVDAATRRDVEKILNQAQRASKIVQNLLTFARQHKAQREYVDVSELLDRVMELRAYQLRVENIDVFTHYVQRPLGVIADPNQLQQVFLNLINNAQDAMTSFRGKGRLDVISERVGDKVQMRFSDNGPGIPPSIQRHLFEPFFTTKEVGKGTGLGLSICYGIIRQHEGRIWAESQAGKGATFTIELPLAHPEEVRAQVAEEPPSPTLRNKTILVVEDELEVALLLKRILREDGHRVLVADDGRTALERVSEAHQKGMTLDLIITDVKMPGLSGPALYEKLRQQEPELAARMVFTTGDTMNASTQDFLKTLSLPCLTKPFSIADVRRIMVDVLGQ